MPNLVRWPKISVTTPRFSTPSQVGISASQPAPLASRAAVDQDRSMRTTTISSILAVGAVALTSPVAAAQAPEHGSCAAFGDNVAQLATTLGPLFGATASGVASSGPAAFPTVVVAPEQANFCEPRP
jgi:hypothetical protein